MQVTTRIIDGCKRRNSYYIANPQTDFYFVDNRFFTKSHPPKIAGFLLLLMFFLYSSNIDPTSLLLF